jgi:hypothetical protein
METLIQDVRYGLRMLRKSPGFTTVAVITLALGIGANTAIFSVVRAVLLKSLPYSSPERLMVLDEYQEHTGRSSVAWPNFLDWQAQSHSFEAMAAYREDHRSFTGVGEPTLLRAGEVSAPFFSVLGVKTILGRTFTDAEDKPNAGPTAVLSCGFWREIGIRIALGASRQNVLTLVLSQGLSLGLLGMAIGLTASFLLTRWMASLLFGVSSRDPITYGSVVLLLCAVALLACYLPARRAAAVDPMVALRYE